VQQTDKHTNHMQTDTNRHTHIHTYHISAERKPKFKLIDWLGKGFTSHSTPK